MSKRPISIQLSRLDKALKAQGVTLKRHQLLEVSAAAFGYRESNGLTAQIDGIVPHEAKPVGVIEHQGEHVVIARDVLSGALFGIDQAFLEQVSAEDDTETWLPTPYGHLAAINELLDKPLARITTPDTEEAHYLWSEVDGEMLFWSNDDGWVGLKDATPFTHTRGQKPVSRGTAPVWLSKQEATAKNNANDLMVEVGKEIFAQARKEAVNYPPIIATFTPQAWVRDYAMEVDPEGETTFHVTVDLIARAIFEGCETLEEYLDGTDNDEFRYASEAPEWIHEWRGPFNIEIDVPTTGLTDKVFSANMIAVQKGEEYTCDPHDGHEHRYQSAEGIDTGTDAIAMICVLCGQLSADT